MTIAPVLAQRVGHPHYICETIPSGGRFLHTPRPVITLCSKAGTMVLRPSGTLFDGTHPRPNFPPSGWILVCTQEASQATTGKTTIATRNTVVQIDGN